MAETNFNFQNIKDYSRLNHKQVNVFNCWEEEVAINPGQLSEAGGKYAVLSLQTAVAALKQKQIDGLITEPVHKKIFNPPTSILQDIPLISSIFLK